MPVKHECNTIVPSKFIPWVLYKKKLWLVYLVIDAKKVEWEQSREYK